MMSGFGCSIPGIMATRTLENERDRLTTMMVLPLMSCGARLTIWMLLIPAFFPPAWRAPALWMIYAIGILLALAGASGPRLAPRVPAPISERISIILNSFIT
jgi:ferrous iron transport protein B